jgi:hypothetical protein
MHVPKPLHLRDYDTFLSHSGEDRDAVNRLYHWLDAVAGIKTWFYHDDLPAGGALAIDLPDAIANARSMVLVLSQSSISRRWVEKEYALAESQQAHYPDYAVVPIKIGDVEGPPGFLPARARLPAPEGKLSLEVAARFVESFYPEDGFDPERAKDVYVSCSWRTDQPLDPVADKVCRLVASRGFRLIGDAREHKTDGTDPKARVKQIVESCGGLVSVLPHRGGGATSAFMLDEISFARNAGLPVLVVVHPDVRFTAPRDADLESMAIRLTPEQLAADAAATELSYAVDRLGDDWRTPPRPHVFLATGFKRENLARNNRLKDVIQRVTGLPCVLGINLQGDGNQRRIVEFIQSAYCVVADVSEPAAGGGGFADNLNTCIEAGIARGASRPLHLVAGGPPRPPVYMFTDIEIQYYQDEAELIGRLHRHIRPYRRRVINRELDPRR